jgi:hypothetical protein
MLAEMTLIRDATGAIVDATVMAARVDLPDRLVAFGPDHDDTDLEPGGCPTKGYWAYQVSIPDLDPNAQKLADLAFSLKRAVGVPAPSKGFLHLDRRDLRGKSPVPFGS